MNDYSDIWWVEYLNKRPHRCRECKFANEYLLYWWYPYFDPTCLKGHSCAPEKHACADFQLIGRLSR